VTSLNKNGTGVNPNCKYNASNERGNSGKLRLPAPPTFLTHTAAVHHAVLLQLFTWTDATQHMQQQSENSALNLPKNFWVGNR